MARHRINFSKNQKFVRRDKIILCFLLLLLSVLLVGVYTSQVKLTQTKSDLVNLQDTLANTQSKKPVKLEKKLQAYWTESTTNWADLFSSLENVKNPDITMLTIDPRLHEKRVLVSGLAKDQESLNFYLTKLESSTALSKVELQRYRRTTQSPNGLEFFAVADWSGHE